MNRSYRTTTALAASLSLMLPGLAPLAQAQEAETTLYCTDGDMPPCTGEADPQGVALIELQTRVIQKLAESGEIDAEDAARAGLDFELLLSGDREAIQQAVRAVRAASADQAGSVAELGDQIRDKVAEAAGSAGAALTETTETTEAERQAQADAEAQAAAQAEAEAQAQAQAQAEADAQAQAEEEARAAREAEIRAEARRAEAEARAAERQAQADERAAAREAEAAARAAEREAEAQARAEARRAAAQDIDPTVSDDQTPVAAAAAEGEGEAAEVSETQIDDENSRQSDEEFETGVEGQATAEAEAQDDDDSDGLSDFQKALLLGAGAVAVGALLKNGQQVVANTGDRVVVEGENGLEIYRDDDALLRQPGADLRTETFNDGSTRSTLTREDGTQVVTIRDAQGRVLRRSRIFADGTEVELFDDLDRSEPVDVRSLREVETAPVTLSAGEADRAALIEALRGEAAVDTGRTYSLRQIREIEPVRALVPAIDLDTLTFATGSAALRPEQAATLVDLGFAIEERLMQNPREVFLIEGHTDAVGGDAYNLALSDRRAETVALALTENFDIPPENLVVQGYGERFLKIEDQGAVQANRRATVRRITPLLQQVASAQ